MLASEIAEDPDDPAAPACLDRAQRPVHAEGVEAATYHSPRHLGSTRDFVSPCCRLHLVVQIVAGHHRNSGELRCVD